MTRTTMLLLFSTALGLAAALGCYTGPGSDLDAATRGPGASADGSAPSPADDEAVASTATGSPAAEGLPCAVAKVLARSCTRCHGAPPRNGAPDSLVTYDDLVAPSDDDPSRNVAEVALERMKATREPMPPEGTVAAPDLASFEAWVDAGTPRGSCGSAKATRDAGSAPALVDSGPMNDAAPIAAGVCTSGTAWTPGTPGSALMAPGKRCITCHSATGGPAFTLAGTVYPTLHEPDGCNGTGSNLSVVIVDATGKSHTIPVNAAGNFIRMTSIPMPYTARVVNGARVREMKTPQTDGDCNGCHSELGARAPGRILAP